MCIAVVAACVFALSSAAPAQHHRGSQSYASATGFANLPAPPQMKGIGTASIRITTKSPEAQRYFDQGSNLLHAFWDMEAYRAFREAGEWR